VIGVNNLKNNNMEEYIKQLEEQNKILKDLNDVNNRLIDTYKERGIIQEQIILLYIQKEKMYSLKERLCKS
jgi:hypothetical protein